MRKIGIVGAEQSGLQLAIGLRREGYETVLLTSERQTESSLHERNRALRHSQSAAWCRSVVVGVLSRCWVRAQFP